MGKKANTEVRRYFQEHIWFLPPSSMYHFRKDSCICQHAGCQVSY